MPGERVIEIVGGPPEFGRRVIAVRWSTMRFCTWPSWVTRITSSRLAGRPTKSIWRNATCSARRGTSHDTGKPWLTSDSRCEALSISSCGSWLVAHSSSSEPAQLGGLQRPHLEQRIHEHPVAQLGRHAPGGRVRRAYQAHFLQVGHHVAHCRRARDQARPGVPAAASRPAARRRCIARSGS